jgi:hypothetical protein
MAAPTTAAWTVALSRNAGSTSASSAAGNAASSPNAPGSPIDWPTSAPPTTPVFQAMNSETPQAQYAARARAGSRCAKANATVSSIIRWLPTSLPNQLRPSTSPTASPNGRWRTLSTSPASTAAVGDPPAATMPTAMNWAPPAKITTDISTGIHHGESAATVIAPKDAPFTAAPAATAVTSRSSAASSVRHVVRIVLYDEHLAFRSSRRTL